MGSMISVAPLCRHMILAQILEINRLDFPSSFYLQSDYITAQIGCEIKTVHQSMHAISFYVLFFSQKLFSFMQFSNVQQAGAVSADFS